jgi:uncharacterized RDD family membrane protein YckC
MFGIGKKKEKAETPVAAPAAPAESAVVLQPAGFWLRVVALIVDNALLLILCGAMLMGAANVGGPELIVPAYWLWVGITFLYWPVLESTALRATIGKAMVGLVVADVDGGRLSFVRSLLRNLAKIISSIPFGIGFLLAAFTNRKQALHDLITKAVVLRKGASSFVRALGVLVVGIVLLFVGSYLAFDYMSGAVMKEMQAMMGGEAPMPAKPAPMSKPVAKPAPAPVAKPAAPPPAPVPVAAAKPPPAPAAQPPAPASAPAPAAKPAAAPAPAPVAKPAPAVAAKPAAKPAAAPTPAPVAKPAPAVAAKPAAKPAPVKVAAAPKPSAMEAPRTAPPAPVQSTRPRVETAQQLSPPGAAPAVSPRFNDVMTAVLYRDRETVSLLLDLGRWIDRRDSNGMTPLMIAAFSGDAATARLLLERGADPGLQAPGGATALEFARQRGDAATTQLLQRSEAR